MKKVIYLVLALMLVVGGLFVFEQHRDLVLAQQQAAVAQQQAAQAQQQLLAKLAEKPTMPVTVAFRNALLTSSYVAIFRNSSSRDLQILATFINPTTNNRGTFTVSIRPHRAKQLGSLEGWAFHSGDRIYLQHADYANKDLVVP